MARFSDNHDVIVKPTTTDLTKHFTSRLTGAEDDTGSTASTEALADALLHDAVRERASDIHLVPHGESTRIRFRIDGELLDANLVPGTVGEHLVNHFRAITDIEPGHLFRPHESRLTYDLEGQQVDLRFVTAPCLGGEAMVIRLLHPENVTQDIHALGLSDDDLDRLKTWLDTASGMLVVTGPTGSGKTTTLYALLHELRKQPRAIFTVEDPVEYEIPGINQISIDADHGLTFDTGLRSLLRMDPDYLMVGEIRDAATAHAALDAALRGRILLSTLHARDPASVITAMRNWDLEDHEIAASTTAIISQRLVRILCPQCKYQRPPTEDQVRWLRALGLEEIPSAVWFHGSCEHCRGLGYYGRTGIFEIWLLDEADHDSIVAGTHERTLYRKLREKNHRTMLEDGLEKANRGIISLNELRAVPDLIPRARHIDGSNALHDGQASHA